MVVSVQRLECVSYGFGEFACDQLLGRVQSDCECAVWARRVAEVSDGEVPGFGGALEVQVQAFLLQGDDWFPVPGLA